MSGPVMLRQRVAVALLLCGMLASGAALAQRPPGPAVPLGTPPPAEAMPRVEFVFEERVMLAPPTVLGDTDLGHRQYIPITGGTIAGPKLKGEVIPGGWDFQLGYPGGCGTLSADYFLRAEDGTVIHILNQAFNCGMAGPGGERSWFRPTFEAPKGSAYEWLTRGTFVASLELERPNVPAASGSAPRGAAPTMAIRIKFYQIK
ncbi:MAG: DUF3237 domain-containing protein [Steroidobacteraceae bacterium]